VTRAAIWRAVKPRLADRFDDAVLELKCVKDVILDSVITCPRCGFARREAMPVDACQFFYDCAGCGARLRPKEGDCCVFCSFGSVPCPPKQAAAAL
jgi:hypothetical protein